MNIRILFPLYFNWPIGPTQKPYVTNLKSFKIFLWVGGWGWEAKMTFFMAK
jgi:hypothetical protein